MGVQQPYMYDSDRRDSRLPEKEFDPKAITRASWEPKPKKAKKQDGPLVQFNRHPDSHEVPTGRVARFRPMSDITKSWIKYMRHVQMGLRVLELIAGIGLVVLMVLITNVDAITTWILRITPGVVALTCAYAIWHLLRPARARPPASSAAYQFFAAFTDLAVLPLYAFGAISALNHGDDWTLILAEQGLARILIQAEYYALLSAGGLHVVSLVISLWLGLIFRRIANMPPDMNPLEPNLTSRVKHKRNKSSVATSYTSGNNSTKRLSDPLESRRRSGAPYENLSRPPSIPFMHTRTGSGESFTSSKRDSRTNLPSRQYQIVPSNSSPRSSVGGASTLTELKRMSSPPKLAQRGSYTEIPLHETGSGYNSPRPSSVYQPANGSLTRAPRFTEAWYASESLIQRTQQRQRAMDVVEKANAKGDARQYEALSHRYDVESDDSDQENDGGMRMMRPDTADVSDLEDDEYHGRGIQSSPINATSNESNNNLHPNPLRSNPMLSTSFSLSKDSRIPRQKTPFRPRDSSLPLSEISINSRSASGSQDIADENPAPLARRPTSFLGGWGRKGTVRGNRNSSIQADDAFCSKSYGDLRAATPPIMIGSGRQVSSGNDFDLGGGSLAKGNGSGRRNVSGKIAEEGMAGGYQARFSYHQ